MYQASIEVDLNSTTQEAAETEAKDIALVSAGNLRRLLAIIDGQEPEPGHTVVSIIESVRSDLNANG